MPSPQGAITQVDPGVYRDAAGNYFRGTSMADAQFIGTTYGGGGAAAAGPATQPAAPPAPTQNPTLAVMPPAGARRPTGAITQVDPGVYKDASGGYFTGTSMADARYIGDTYGGGGAPGSYVGDTVNHDMGPSGPTGTAFGAAPPPFVSQPWTGGAYTPKPLPKSLDTPYEAPTWSGGDFVDPTMEQVKAGPGYQTRMDAGQQALEHAAAAKGSVLSGGFQKAIAQYGQDYGTGEFQTARGNAYQNYLGKYGRFQDANANALGARNQNLNEWGTQNALGLQAEQNQYSRYLTDNQRQLGDYVLNTTNTRNASTDYWSRLRDLYGGGANAAANSYHPGS